MTPGGLGKQKCKSAKMMFSALCYCYCVALGGGGLFFKCAGVGLVAMVLYLCDSPDGPFFCYLERFGLIPSVCTEHP